MIKFLKYDEYRNYRSSHLRCSLRKGILRNFAKFTRKHLNQSPFSNRTAGLRPATLLKKILWYRYFPVNFGKILRTPFFTEQLWTTASETTTKFSWLESMSSIEEDYSFTLVIYLFQVFLDNCKRKLSFFIVKMFFQIGFKVSEYRFKQNKTMLKNKTVLLYTYFYNISLNALRSTFVNIHIIYPFYTLQKSVKLGSNLDQKLATFPLLWAPALTKLQFSIFFFTDV